MAAGGCRRQSGGRCGLTGHALLAGRAVWNPERARKTKSTFMRVTFPSGEKFLYSS